VPVPKIEKLAADLYRQRFRNTGVFDQTEVVIIKAKASQVGNPGPTAVIEVKAVCGLEGILAEEGLARLEAAFVLGKRINPGFNCRNATDAELSGNVALA
jgi:hypothetical protein